MEQDEEVCKGVSVILRMAMLRSCAEQVALRYRVYSSRLATVTHL